MLLLGLLVFATCIPTQAVADLFNFVLRCPLSDSKPIPEVRFPVQPSGEIRGHPGLRGLKAMELARLRSGLSVCVRTSLTNRAPGGLQTLSCTPHKGRVAHPSFVREPRARTHPPSGPSPAHKGGTVFHPLRTYRLAPVQFSCRIFSGLLMGLAG